MSKLTPFQQALATNMGQEKLDSDNLVTLVRRRFLLEEVVLTREQYENYSSDVEEDVFTWDLLDWKNAQWEDYEFENTYYSAYEGDITSFTDDVVAFMQPDPEDRLSYEQLPLLNSDDFYDQFNK
tara:strand:+ start:2243 stop:2617 length:375 start_codon:yes stop_codon:yes gene_type:complete